MKLYLEYIRGNDEENVSNRSINILGMFSRPEKLTEEEVTVSKERKICLVCKGKVLRKIYLCPECNALYCVKCSDTLASMENACWSCEAPFDETKPKKLPNKEKSEELLVDEEKQERGKVKKSNKKLKSD